MSGPAFPHIIAIDPDEYAANGVGHTVDGRQVFIARPFIPARDDARGREFIAVYLFNQTGELQEAQIDDLGPRSDLDPAIGQQLIQRRMAALGPLEARRIEIRPFAVERFGTVFGLIPRPSDEPEEAEDWDTWWVEAQPGNYMAFHAPWDSGEYDT
jgi:hypothetical protein